MERYKKTVILADGEFPTHTIPLSILENCTRVICCDGAAVKLSNSGIREPDYIVGDLDSLEQSYRSLYGNKVVHVGSQDTNDLTKAFEFALANGFDDIAILGATGLREDHTLGNISLLYSYAEQASVELYTNFGRFIALSKASKIESKKGQQVSIFSLTPNTPISYRGLKWDISDRPLNFWWEGTLNEAIGDHFYIDFEEGKLVVYLLYF
jgi:thiamine pyrophosphokinase